MNKVYTWIKDFLAPKKYLQTLLVFFVFFSLFSLVYFSVNQLSSGDDHFFHFRFAEEIREEGFSQSFGDFKALYFSKMAQGGDYAVYYKGILLRKRFNVDFVVYDKIILEVKARETIINDDIAQVINYLKLSGCRLGIIVNFGRSKLEVKRLVN